MELIEKMTRTLAVTVKIQKIAWCFFVKYSQIKEASETRKTAR